MCCRPRAGSSLSGIRRRTPPLTSRRWLRLRVNRPSTRSPQPGESNSHQSAGPGGPWTSELHPERSCSGYYGAARTSNPSRISVRSVKLCEGPEHRLPLRVRRHEICLACRSARCFARPRRRRARTDRCLLLALALHGARGDPDPVDRDHRAARAALEREGAVMAGAERLIRPPDSLASEANRVLPHQYQGEPRKTCSAARKGAS